MSENGSRAGSGTTRTLAVLALATLVFMVAGWRPALRAEETISDLIVAWKSDEVMAMLKAQPALLNKQDKDGYTPLILACTECNGKLVAQILDLNPNLEIADSGGQTALIRAAKNGSLDSVKLLVAKGAKLATKEGNGNTAEMIARERNHPDVADYLKAMAANPAAPVAGNPAGLPPAAPPAPTPAVAPPITLLTDPTTNENFLQAIANWHVSIGENLLKRQPEAVNVLTADHECAVYLAAAQANPPLVQFLLDLKADLTLVNNAGETALHGAVRGNSVDSAKLLVAAGADPTIKNKAGETPLELAKKMYRAQLVPILTDAMAGKIPAAASAPGSINNLIAAIARDDLTTVKASLAQSPALASQTDRNGRTALHFAMTSQSEIAAFLLTQKADANKADTDNWRPIHIAAEAGRADMVKLLLDNEADPNSAATQGAQTPLYIAAVYGFTEVAKNLLAAHANPNLNTSRGVSPLHRAAESGYTDIVSLLILAKADLNAKDQTGKTALDYAINAKRGDVVALLVKYGATATQPVPAQLPTPPQTPGATPASTSPVAPASQPGVGKADPTAALDPVQATAFLEACTNDDETKINAMIKDNPNIVYAHTETGYTALHLLAHKCQIETYRKILDLGVPVDIRHKYQRTPLHRAAEFGTFEMLKELVDRGASVNALNDEKQTPLHFAARNNMDAGEIRCLNYLLDHKADPTLKNMDGFTPYGEAKRNNNQLTIAALEARGIKE